MAQDFLPLPEAKPQTFYCVPLITMTPSLMPGGDTPEIGYNNALPETKPQQIQVISIALPWSLPSMHPAALVEHEPMKGKTIVPVSKPVLDLVETILALLGSSCLAVGVDILANGPPFSYWQWLLLIMTIGVGSILIVMATWLQWYERRQINQ